MEALESWFAPLRIGTFAVRRITAGVIMATHGWQKLADVHGFRTSRARMEMPVPHVLAWMAIVRELLGGLGLVGGLLDPVAAFGVLCVMLVPIVKVHLTHGLFSTANGFDYPLVIAMIALFLVAHGGGRFSYVGPVFGRGRRQEWGRARERRDEALA